MKPAVFLDRDGVINADVTPYVTRVAELRLFPYTVASLKRLHEAGFDLFVVSNQQGVGKGLVDPEELERITEAIQGELRNEGFEIKKFFYCTSLDEAGDPRRKPGTGMLLEARDEFGIELKGSFFIGDKPSDMEAAAVSGCRPLLVLSGVTHSADSTENWRYGPEKVFPTLAEAADWLCHL